MFTQTPLSILYQIVERYIRQNRFGGDAMIDLLCEIRELDKYVAENGCPESLLDWDKIGMKLEQQAGARGTK